jgi:F-type H+-transporting ATPase subunit gamma
MNIHLVTTNCDCQTLNERHTDTLLHLCCFSYSISQQARRGMATEKQLSLQITSTKNIRKITSSMKMVAAAKLKGDESRLAAAKPFNTWAERLCSAPQESEDATFDDFPQKTLLVPFTSDKGLCGGVNSFVTRAVKKIIAKVESQGKSADVVVIGDKGRGQLNRTHSSKIIRTATHVVSPGSFGLASGLASELIAAGAKDYDAVVIIYNSYVNAATYKQMYKIITPFDLATEDGGSLPAYDFDSDKPESMGDLFEFMMASQIYHSFMDGAASEQSSRMTAMEGATQNAGELIDSLTLKYNRARQARITTELIEIISGASALDDK